MQFLQVLLRSKRKTIFLAIGQCLCYQHKSKRNYGRRAKFGIFNLRTNGMLLETSCKDQRDAEYKCLSLILISPLQISQEQCLHTITFVNPIYIYKTYAIK